MKKRLYLLLTVLFTVCNRLNQLQSTIHNWLISHDIYQYGEGNNQSITSKETFLYLYPRWSMWMEVSFVQYDSLQIQRDAETPHGPVYRKVHYRIKFNEKEKFLGKGYANANHMDIAGKLHRQVDDTEYTLTRRSGQFISMKKYSRS